MYKLRARFSTSNETPTHPLITYHLKMQKSKKDREIYFENLPSKEELKKIIQNHYKKYEGNKQQNRWFWQKSIMNFMKIINIYLF